MQTTEQPKTSRYLQANSPIQVPSAGVSKAIPWNVRPRQRWAFYCSRECAEDGERELPTAKLEAVSRRKR
jgi:hypothetical protein